VDARDDGEAALGQRLGPPFKLLYDLRWMQLGHAGGIEQAAYELVSAVAILDRRNAYGLFAPRSASWEWEFPARFRVTRHPSDAGHGAGALPYDLVHSTCSFIQPEMLGFRGVLTIQDLQHLHHPEFFSRADFEDRERLYRTSAERAAHIICGSEFTRRDVHQRYGVPLERMTTIWNIPTRSVWGEIEPRRRRALLDAMGVRGRFLLYPAQPWAHKNHAGLLRAIAAIAAELPPDLTVILTGRPFAPDHPAAALLREPALHTRVRHLGYRSPLEVRALMQECEALVFPSLFEGFGMPVAEAIIAGKPVACSNVTSLPELAGDAAAMFDPGDTDGMAARILEVATDARLRAALSEAARRRRTVFSARSSALRTLAVYERVFAQGRGA
jgi:glycosyltransferase involved in cell wall biosynthesis